MGTYRFGYCADMLKLLGKRHALTQAVTDAKVAADDLDYDRLRNLITLKCNR